MHLAELLIIVIGIFCGTLASAEVELSEDGGSLKPNMVFVEPTNVNTVKIDGEYHLKPYLERRHDWGSTVSFGYVYYEPVNYEPNFATGSFGDFYKKDDMPLVEAQFTVKRNLSIGSIGAELAVGAYSNGSDVPITVVDSTLSLYPVRFGANFTLDALGPEPYIVPYVSGGLYTMVYKESQATASKNGNTQVAPYFNLGAEFMLDWIDRRAARIAYRDSGLEATYVFLEVRKMMASQSSSDPDFSDEINFAGGLRVEF